MKAVLIKENVFTVKINGIEIPGMRQVSKWNGMVELRNDKGEKLIVQEQGDAEPNPIDAIFSRFLRTGDELRTAGILVIMGSPGLMAMLNAPAPTPAGQA